MSVTRRLAVITGLGSPSEDCVEAAVHGLRSRGWHVLRRARLGSSDLDHVVVGPGGLFVAFVRLSGGRLRREWSDEAAAQAAALERLTGRAATPLLVLSRAPEWAQPRFFHGVTALSAGALTGHLLAQPSVLAPNDVEALRTGLRMALAA